MRDTLDMTKTENPEADQIVAILHECATNDMNGNPRRAFVAIGGTGHILRIEDEGYAGRPDWVRGMADEGVYDVVIEVTPKQYRNRMKMAKELAK